MFIHHQYKSLLDKTSEISHYTPTDTAVLAVLWEIRLVTSVTDVLCEKMYTVQLCLSRGTCTEYPTPSLLKDMAHAEKTGSDSRTPW